VNTIRKYVFSSSLKQAEWNNSTVISEDSVAAVSELKQQDGGDLMIYGHGRFGQTLLDSPWGTHIRSSCKSARFGTRLSLCSPRLEDGV
jgi:dihydrofolate reductase